MSDHMLMAVAQVEFLLAEVERLKAVEQERDRLKQTIPSDCPITGLPFFMVLEHPDLGWVPTYGGPDDSYTIPEPEHDSFHGRVFVRQRYDHDEGVWTEGGEELDVRLIEEKDLCGLQDRAERAERERDALRAAIDRHVASKVCQAYQSDPSWIAAGLCGVAFFTRAEAEAAYRKATGLDVGAAAAQVVVHGEDGERD